MALRGDGWVTMGELWQLLAGFGPAYDRALTKAGYLPKKLPKKRM
jgi:hypothetical protein